MASDGATRCHAVVLPPRYKRATRTLMPHIRGTAPAIVGLHALHDTLNGACAEVVTAGRCQAARTHDRFFFAVVDATTNYLHVLFNPLEQFRFLKFKHGTLACFDPAPKPIKLFRRFSA